MSLVFETHPDALRVTLLSPAQLEGISHAQELKRLGFFAKPKESVIYKNGSDYLLYVGCDEKSSDRFMVAGAVALKVARKARFSHMAFSVDSGEAARDCAMGAVLASYTYTRTRSVDEKDPQWQVQGLFCTSHETDFQEGMAIAASMNFTRELGDLPGNIVTPASLAQTATQLAQQFGFECTVIDQEEAAKLGMGAFYSVAKGSAQPGKMIILRNTSPEKKAPLMLVGKGLTFDTGGISIKPSASMEEMKYDMCGGAAVLGAFHLMGSLGIRKDVAGIVPAAENMPSGTANKPGDIVTACNGKTIEVINTDAEGRLILCDALAHGTKTYQPSAIVDIATLTGACVVALGSHAIGVISNNDEYVREVTAKGATLHERLWQLPAYAEYDEQLKSDFADMQNVGGKEAGTITAGLFLQKFVPENTPWVHLDVAGTAWDGKKEYFHKKGATGSGVRTFYALIKDL